MKRLSLLSISILIISLFTPKANATSNDYVVLESIRAINTTVTLEDDLVYELTVSAPSTFSWSPTQQNIDGRISILLCSNNIYDSEINDCNYSNQQAKFQIRNIQEIGVIDENNFKFYKFTVSGVPTISQEGEYFPYLVKKVRASILYPEYETHYYYFNKINPNDGFADVASINSPNFFEQKITVFNPVIPEPEPVAESTPEPEPTPDPDPAPVQQPVVNNPAPRAVTSAPSLVAPQVIQSNFYLPAIAGDINWKPMKQIKGKFDGWQRLKKNALNGGKDQVTKTNGSMITFRSEGDALSLRFLGGKKRGIYSIYVNGALLDRVDAKRKKKRALIRTWEGLGEGNHFIDIVAELQPGQSLAIDGVHSPRS